MTKKVIAVLILFIFIFTSISVDFLYLKHLPVPLVNGISVVYADTTNPYCLPTNDGTKVGTFSQEAGYCVLEPEDSAGKCLAPYIYSTDRKVCISQPLCPGTYIWNAETKRCESITATPVGDTEPVFPDNSCAVDSNGNGEIEQNEIHQCQQTPQGYICPTGQTQCNPQYQQPSCPAQYTYNANTQKCEYTPTVGVCSSQQVQITQYQCPVNGRIYSELDTCNNNCIQTAQCTTTTGTVTASGSIIGGQYANKLVGNGNRIDGYCWYCTENGGWGYIGSIYLNGCTASGSIGDQYDRLVGNGNRIDGYCWYCTENGGWGYMGSISLTSTTTTFTCPLGNYPCTGNPPTCQKGQACVTYNQTVTKWQCSLTGTQYDTQEQCTTSCYSGCPPGGTFNPSTGKCEATATCQTGTLQPEGCFTGYGCPLGNYQCQNLNGTWMCSPHQCITSSQLQDEGDVIPFGYEDDGQRDAQGNCLGTIYIFNGKGMRCRKSGVDTGFHNCCNESRGKLYDSTGSIGGGLGAIWDLQKVVSGVYTAINLGTNVSKATLIQFNAATGKAILSGPTGSVTYALDSSQANALWNTIQNTPGAATQVGGVPGSYVTYQVQNPDLLTAGSINEFLKQSGIASSVVSLATSMIIKDPVLSSAVNVCAQSILAIAGYGSVLGVATAVASLAMALFMEKCDQQDIMTSTFNDSGYCHEVGEYCIKKWPMVGCVQKAKSFCCFNSKLARIIHEQGRPQLEVFQPNGAWTGIPGDPNFSVRNPNCRGFTPEEFQSLDFNKIDLSEYIEDIQRNIRQNLAPQLQQQIQQNWGR